MLCTERFCAERYQRLKNKANPVARFTKRFLCKTHALCVRCGSRINIQPEKRRHTKGNHMSGYLRPLFFFGIVLFAVIVYFAFAYMPSTMKPVAYSPLIDFNEIVGPGEAAVMGAISNARFLARIQKTRVSIVVHHTHAMVTSTTYDASRNQITLRTPWRITNARDPAIVVFPNGNMTSAGKAIHCPLILERHFPAWIHQTSRSRVLFSC